MIFKTVPRGIFPEKRVVATVQINVSQQLKATIGEVRNYEVDGSVSIEGSGIDVKGDVRLMRTDRGILARGVMNADIELTCSRCLSRFHQHLKMEIEEEFFPTIDVNTGTAVSLPEETDCFTIDENNILDLTDAVRQYAVMNMPIKPLCTENCAGLCPTCGANLNKGDCGCPAKPVDPRWNGLRKLVLTDGNQSASKKKGT
jgi:uncharacterized protein